MQFKEYFDKKFRLQQIGTALLILAIILLLNEVIILCYIDLGIVLAIDLYLAYQDKKKGDVRTITQWFKPIFPKRIDVIITLALVVLFICTNPVYGLYFLVGTIHGHLSGNW